MREEISNVTCHKEEEEGFWVQSRLLSRKRPIKTSFETGRPLVLRKKEIPEV